MKRNYIGLACTGHDNSIAILSSEGKLVFAEASERYLQNKRAINSPPDDMIRIESLINDYCEPDALLVVSKTWSEQSSIRFSRENELAKQRMLEFNSESPSDQFLAANANVYRYVMEFVGNNVRNTGQHLQFRCDTSLQRSVVFKSYDHHLTHAATGSFTSPFSDAMCVIVDGFGEGSSIGIYHYLDGKIQPVYVNEMLGNIEKSIGVFYGTLCGWCGFDLWRGEEWKVMGLAPYGKLNQDIYDLMHKRIAISELDVVCPVDGNKSLNELLGYSKNPDQTTLDIADLAYTGQVVFCELLNTLLTNVHRLGLSDNLVLGGGCALNSSYCGKILDATPFKRLHVSSAPGDDGNALGAAYLAYYEDHSKGSPVPFFSPYSGSEMSEETLSNMVQFSGVQVIEGTPDSIAKQAASLLADGMIIGWVQGKAEFGPRALGNRSILADPRSADMKDKINARVKFREEFRPFAPSVLHEFGEDYFVNYQESPYMERTLLFRPEMRSQVPAVVHKDGTGRVQTVKDIWNPEFHRLIQCFREITGIPMLLNTSFNVMGKPIIHSVEDALAVFFTSGLDILVIGNRMLIK